LLCNGAAVSRITYSQLFAAIGTTWGVGDGSTTFNVPNLADYVTAGTGGALGALGAQVGSSTHAIAYLEMPAHNHVGSTGTVQVGSGGGGSIPTAANLSPITTNPVTLNIATAGGGVLNTSGQPMTIVQQTAIMQKIIRYE
jgi:microcystin-dependent protein